MLAMMLWFGMFLNSHAQLPESARSQRAVIRYTAPLQTELQTKNLSLGAPVFLRITKTQNQNDRQGRLEAFVENEAGAFILFKTWDICTYSGALGQS
jgi:murein L,D-transpeptidase YafK